MKIFCIGLNKTGTRSLHHALETLGFRSLHWGGPASRAAVERAMQEGRPLLDHLGDYDAFSDIEVLSVNFDVLDTQYPGSKFVLTVRNLAGWLDSRRRHVEKNRAAQAAGTYSGSFLTVDYDGWTRDYMAHWRRVHRYFATRPGQLLVMDIVAGDGYEVLCPFLGVPAVEAPFPRLGSGDEPASD